MESWGDVTWARGQGGHISDVCRLDPGPRMWSQVPVPVGAVREEAGLSRN